MFDSGHVMFVKFLLSRGRSDFVPHASKCLIGLEGVCFISILVRCLGQVSMAQSMTDAFTPKQLYGSRSG